jgi:hypothetical protein
VDHPKPIGAFTKLMGRFSHLDEEGQGELQRLADERFNQIEALTRMNESEQQVGRAR